MSEIQDRLNELLEYRDGKVYWKVDRGSRKCKGKEAGTDHGKGYKALRIRELGGSMLLHRVIWIMHHGDAPEMLDHINNDKSDNRIENLRPATRVQNGYNRAGTSINTTGVKNVSWVKRNKKWGVNISVNGKRKWIGLFEDLELADLVAQEVRHKYHGQYAHHGVQNVRD